MSGCQESQMSEDAQSANPTTLTVKEKKCAKCQNIKEISAFGLNNRIKDKHDVYCRLCKRNKYRLWYKSNSIKVCKNTKAWRDANPQKVKGLHLKKREKNPEKYKALVQGWYKRNKEKAFEQSRKWKKAHPEKSYWKTHPEKAKVIGRRANQKRYGILKNRLNRSLSCAVWRSLRGTKNKKHWEDLVGYSLEQLKKHLVKQFKNDMSWDNYGKWHIDHIIPISVFNFEKPEDDDFKRCWALSNLQPLWALDNIKKKDKIEKQFQPKLIFK